MNPVKVASLACKLAELTPKELAVLVAYLANDREKESTMQIMEYCYNTPRASNKYL